MQLLPRQLCKVSDVNLKSELQTQESLNQTSSLSLSSTWSQKPGLIHIERSSFLKVMKETLMRFSTGVIAYLE